jgi:hypothetical protein
MMNHSEKPAKTRGIILKSIFSTANLNGTAAVLMSLDMGSLPASALYIYAVLAGTWNKYQSLKNDGATDSGPDNTSAISRVLKDPSITARVLMAAAAYNFVDSGMDLLTGAEGEQAAHCLRMLGWVCGFLGDNALRRLDMVNFKKDATLGEPPKSKLRETFNALTANPTIFYNGASMAFTLALLSGKASNGFASLEGGIGLAALCLVLTGIGHAIRRTWKATKGEIDTGQINDGVMNYCSSASKATQSIVALMSGKYWLATAQLIFTASNIKVIQETREALGKKTPESDPKPGH